ncbi:TetR family transcriptional regulator [Kribbella sp. VKM Ac-2568]|uniref:TetR family transcriptional regulator n=1 Tax=Kribbella sp. VKM Ac-2568 TaxID=2512219 RepID=UPI00104997A0|nr:TetR family transcriptional regulator [Kribbella sp. VKM Ac-2568]TCM50504.1 TetR family transcriptional regulator [Kribbella sp. VKM Ac-2568]
MGRWEPDAAGRLREAAMALYAEQGFDGTTVADIADRAGVTARTFFRHFVDKREVLFAGSEELQRRMVDALTGAPRDAEPMDAITIALLAAAELFADRRDHSRRRQAVIAATPELREREFIKMASLVTAFTEALRQRGVEPDTASLAAETGIAVFRVAFERWVTGPEDADLADVMRGTLADLSELTA